MGPYPKMKPDQPLHLPTDTGNSQLLWQALAAQMPPLAGLRVLILHPGDGWICREAINAGAIAVLGIDDDAKAISAARSVASSDRLRYRIMPDEDFARLTGPYDVIAGVFDLARSDMAAITAAVSPLLRAGGQMLCALAAPPSTPQLDEIALKHLFSANLAIEQMHQLEETFLPGHGRIHLVAASRHGGRPAPHRPANFNRRSSKRPRRPSH